MKLKIITGIMLTLLTLSIVIVFMGEALLPSVTAQTNPTATVYLDPPIINGSEIGVGQNFTVNLNIVDAVNIYAWQAGLIFNATVVECLNYMEGEFLSENGAKQTYPAAVLTINNTLGIIEPYGWTILGNYPPTNGSGTLGYLKFRVKALGVSDMHLQDVKAVDWVETSPGYWEKINIPLKIIDVYTVFVDTTPHTVVTVSNSTGLDTIWVGGELVTVHSGFYDHAFNASLEEVSFKVTGPYTGWSNVTIPKTLLNVSTLDEWTVIIDSSPLSADKRTVAPNATHHSIIFAYAFGIHEVEITTRGIASSNISINLSSDSISKGSSVTISGEIDPLQPNVTVTIEYKPSGGTTWTTVGTNKTDSNSHYSYTWTPQTAGTYEIRASWAGYGSTAGDTSDLRTLEVKGAAGFDPYLIVAAAVVIIIIVAVVIYYFVKVRKPEEEE